MANKKKSKKSSSGHCVSSSSSSSVVVASSNQNIANVRNIFAQPVNLDSCLLCDDHKPKGLSKKSKRQGVVIPHTLKEFWLEAPIKKKLQLLQMDCKFVLDQIRCSSPYTTKEGDKPAFLSKPSSCLCPACRKKKAIFNAVIAVFEDYVNELEGKPPSANSASQQVAASFQYSTKLKPNNNNTTTQQPLAISSDCTTNNSTTTTSIQQPSTEQQQHTSTPNNSQQGTTLNDHVHVSKQISKISEKTQFLIEDEANNSNTTSTTNTTETIQTIATSDNSTLPQNEVQLPFGRYLTVKNGKITVTDDYVRKDNGEHFLKVIQKCEENFPFDLKLSPNEFPIPENIHTLINYCTANSEVNIKKIMLNKNSKKTYSHNHHHSLTSPQKQNQVSAPNNSNVMTSQILNLFQQQQGGATATLTLGSNGTTVLNNVNVQMVTDQKQNTKTTPPTSSQNSSSLSTSHLQVQVPPSVTITATSSALQTHNQKSSVVVHSSPPPNSSTAALVVSGSIDMTSAGSGSAQNMKVVNGSIAMVHLGNVKDLIRNGESNSVVLNNLHHEGEDEEEEEEEEEEDDDVIDDEDEEEEDEEDDEGEDEDDIESETDDEETLDEYSQSDTDEEISNDKGSPNHHSDLRLKNRSLEHDDQHYSKRRIARDKRHGHQKEGDNQKEQDEKNEILASNMRESKLLFQIYLARLFSHNIRVAYNDLCASEMQKCLLEEYERESEMKTSNPSKNSKSKKSKKNNKKKEEKSTPAKKSNPNKTPEKQSTAEIPKAKHSEEVVSPNPSISTNNDYDSGDENYEEDNLSTEEQEEDDYYETLDYDYAYDDDFENRGAVQDWNVVTKKPKQPKSVTHTTPIGGASIGTTTPRGPTYNTFSNRGRGGSSVRGGRGGHIMSSPSLKPTNGTIQCTPSKVTTTLVSGTPQKLTPSFYSVNSNSVNNNQPKNNSINEKQQTSHQFHSQHVKTTTSSHTTIIPSNSGNISGTPLPVPVPTPQPLPQTQQLQQNQQGGFVLLPSAVNGANSKITKHSRQQSSGSVSSNNTSLESSMHSFINQTPGAGNSTVSSVVGELLNEDEYLMLSGLKRSTTPSTTGASTSSPNSVGSGSNSLPNPQTFQNQHSLFGGSNVLFDSSSFGNIAKNNMTSNGNNSSPRSNSLMYNNPFDMGMQYNNPNVIPQYNVGSLGMSSNGLYPNFNLFGAPTTNSSFPMTGTIQQAPQQSSNASWSLFQGYGSFSWNPIIGNNGNLSNVNLQGGLSNVNIQPSHSTSFNSSGSSTLKNTIPSE